MIDIILPIYNAHDYVIKCLNSIKECTDLTMNRLVMIEDKSSDERILPLLKQFKDQNQDLNIIVIENENNLGFVASVNKGMRYAKNDVILLNSDTEVPSHWIENLKRCAYSEPDIATVTALSNNATLASVPCGLQPNELPTNLSFQEYAKLIEDISFKDYPQIPTAHGFCMYIKRSILDVVGYFDEERFGRGYGEENDFSYRCLDFGFKHVLCDDVIVYHKESQSFSEDKTNLINANLKILKDNYPIYYKKTESWCERFPISYLCKNIIYNMGLKDRINILFVIHDWKDINNNLGGTSLHCLDLILHLRHLFNFHVLTPEDGLFKVYSYFEHDESTLLFDGVMSAGLKGYYNKDYRRLVKQIISGLNISAVHIHHMIGHFFDIADICKEYSVKSLITLHDFYSLCPTINLLHEGKDYCLPLQEKRCDLCLKAKLGISNDIINVWRKQWEGFLTNIDTIITPSISTKEIIESQLKGVNCVPIEHGINISVKQGSTIENTDQFNIAFVGVMAIHKGADTAQYLINTVKKSTIKFHLFGDSELETLKRNKSNYVYHGKYKRDELSSLMKKHNIHLVCNLSVWPETYSYTLTETIACGIPVLSYDIGAVGERIKKYGFGWVIEPGKKEWLKDKIIQLSTDDKEYNHVISNLNAYKIKTVSDMIVSYEQFYDSEVNAYDMDKLHVLIRLDQKSKATGSNSELDRILNSARWKLVSKLNMPSVFKKIGKKLVG